MQSITLDIPSGIGDVSWILSKLVHVKDREIHLRVADGWPHRTVKFLQLFPWIASAEYGAFNYEDIFAFQSYNKDLVTWEAIKELTNCPLAPNYHLERGKPLADWLPDLPTEFHYEIPVSEEEQDAAFRCLGGLKRPIVALSAASYRGSEAWKTWEVNEWMDFLCKLRELYGQFTVLLMGGFWDDLTASLAFDLHKKAFLHREVVGRTSIGAAIEVLRHVDRYVGFSSGLGIISTVLRKPTFMLWPNHQVELSTSWAPPKMLESRQYMMSGWRNPDDVLRIYSRWMEATS